MTFNIKQVQLKDLLLEPIRNGLTKPKAIRGRGVPMIAMGEIFANNRIFSFPMERVPVTDKELSSSSIYEGDLLFARQSLVLEGAGKCCIVKEVNEPTVFESHLIRVRLDNSKALPDYIYYYFNSYQGKENIKTIVEQVAAAGIRGRDLVNLYIPIPPITVQQQILQVLMNIDDKIAINTTINENLEQQAQALFKAWFVDFEPFGGAMPDDWTETTLGTIAAISTKSINPLKQPDLYLEHYSIPAYDEQHYPVFEYANEIKSNKYVLTKNSVMISKLNPATKRIWRPLCLSDNPVCSTEFIVYEAIDPKHKDYIYSLIDSQSFSDYLCAHTTGSTNSRQRATPKTTLDFPCVLPTNDTISQFCGVVTPIYNQIGANLIENQRLASLRDTLLPKLMNGEIDVSEVKI